MEKNNTTDQNPEVQNTPEENTKKVAEATKEEIKESNADAVSAEKNTEDNAEKVKQQKGSDEEPTEVTTVVEDQPLKEPEKENSQEAKTKKVAKAAPKKLKDSKAETASAEESPKENAEEVEVAKDSDEESGDKTAADDENQLEALENEDALEKKGKVEKIKEEPSAEVEENKESEDEKPEDDSIKGESEKDKASVDNDEDEDDGGEDGDDDEDEDDEAFEEYSEKELISRLEELVQTEDISKIKTKVALIKVAFMRILKEKKQEAMDKFIEEGGKKEDFAFEETPSQKRFNKAFEQYRKNKIKHNELQEKLKQENLQKKNDILEQLKELINSEETLKKTYDNFRALQAEWKDIGMVPAGEVSNLWQSYHFLVEKFFDKVKINKELRDLDMKKNLELKIELCEKTEELLLEKSIIKSFKLLQQYHQEWKGIGPVPQEQNDEVWERFKAATDKINERRRDHYGKLQEEQEKNLLAKTDLCEKAEELLATTPETFREWQQQTNKMNELFKLWRSIGRAPKKNNNEIWDRFKESMNTFYNNKKEFMKTIKDEQLNNYNLKVDLCVQAENIKDNTDWKRTTQELIKLQNEWKNIGPVPRKHSDKIWKRFRAACDEFFNNKSDHFSNIHEKENENLDKKKDLIERVKKQKFGKDKSKNLDILKEFQREWMDIGFVPMKEKDNVQKEFRAAVDSRLDELQISTTELSNASYATRMEAVKDSPEASRVYRKEINFLNNKISKLREDVNLWENNLGFFANSKKADLLKQEFEQKIVKAKQELAGMEAKVKYLRKMESES